MGRGGREGGKGERKGGNGPGEGKGGGRKAWARGQVIRATVGMQNQQNLYPKLLLP